MTRSDLDDGGYLGDNDLPIETRSGEDPEMDDSRDGPAEAKEDVFRCGFRSMRLAESLRFSPCPWVSRGLIVLVLACFALAIWVWAQILSIEW